LWNDRELRDRRVDLDLPFDENSEIARIAGELETSFRMYADPRYVKKVGEPISAIRFYWAGTEVDPFVPSTVWGDGWLSHRYEETEDRNVLAHGLSNFHECGGFDLGPIADLLVDADEDRIKHLVLRSIHLAERALAIAVKTDAFARLAKREGFELFATPGHDEPSVRLLVPLV